MARFMDNGW